MAGTTSLQLKAYVQAWRLYRSRRAPPIGTASHLSVRCAPRWGAVLALCLVGLLATIAAWGKPPMVAILTVDGAITPATMDYIARGLKRSVDAGAELVVLQLDTPGGLDTAMRDIIKAILASPVPVATFVFPGGARAASAGTYIVYASHVASMAPGTNIGAATPVQIGIGGTAPAPADETPRSGTHSSDKDAKAAAQRGDAMTEKQVQDASAYIRGLAQLRGRNTEWAERAVREAASLTAGEAMKLGVIDRVATSVEDLLQQLHGSNVVVQGQSRTLNTAGAELLRIDPDWRSRLLGVIATPTLALLLMMLGIYGLLFEFLNPGAVLPGVVGGICLLLALFAFQLLPMSHTGLALIALGLAFMVAEHFLPTFGVLGVGGVVAFVIGGVILMDSDIPGYGIPLPLVVTLALGSALFVFVVVRLAMQSRRRPVVAGGEELVGVDAEVLEDFASEGWATVHGERWHVRSGEPCKRGQQVRVTGIDGLTLHVASRSTPQSTGASR